MSGADEQWRGPWPIRRLFDLCHFIPGKAHEPFIDPLGDYICVNSKFISTEGAVAKACNKSVTPARKGDILMVMSDLPNGRALAKCFLVNEDEKYAVNQRICILRPKADNDPELLFHILNRNPYFLAFDDGVNQTHLLNPTFQKCEIAVPETLHEQQAIAAALSDADGVVAGLERVIAKKRLIKQGAMQDLLTARRRLPGFSGEWEKRKLGTVAMLQRGFDLPNSLRKDGDYPVVYSNGIMATNTDYMCEGPGVVTGRSGTIGNLTFVDSPYWPHNTALWVKNFFGNSPRFVFYLLQFIDLRRFASGSGVPTLNRNDAHDDMVFVPKDLNEQKAICVVLDDMDAEIQTLESRLTKARAVKEGMMQNLLTGRVRLV